MAETRLVCVECEAWADWSAAGWEAHLVSGDDDRDEVLIYCPGCAQREFHSPPSEPPSPDLLDAGCAPADAVPLLGETRRRAVLHLDPLTLAGSVRGALT